MPGIGGASIQPVGRVHLEPAVVVLAQDREQPVVRVLGHAPVGTCRPRLGRVAEDAEQHERVRGEVDLEPVGVEAEPQRHAPQHGVAEGRHRLEVVEDGVAELGDRLGEEVRAVERGAGAYRASVASSSAPK